MRCIVCDRTSDEFERRGMGRGVRRHDCSAPRVIEGTSHVADGDGGSVAACLVGGSDEVGRARIGEMIEVDADGRSKHHHDDP